MGLILFLILLVAFIMWVLSVVFLIIRVSKGQMTSLWSIPLLGVRFRCLPTLPCFLYGLHKRKYGGFSLRLRCFFHMLFYRE